MSWNTDPRTIGLIEQNRSTALQGSISDASSNLANTRALIAENGRAAAEQATANAAAARGSDKILIGELLESLDEAKMDKAKLQDQLRLKEAELKERVGMIVEWRHSNEAYKKLAQKYSKKIGDELGFEFTRAVIDVADENPEEYGDTNLNKKARKIVFPNK